MAIEIGSNFMYRGHRYLDERLNKVSSINDLRDWTIPIPNGFEVFFDGHWYTYNSDNSFDDVLGYFRIRSEIVQDFGNSVDVGISQKVLTDRFNSIGFNVNKLIQKVFPLTISSFTISPELGNKEIGIKVNEVKASWYIHYEGDSTKLNPISNSFSILGYSLPEGITSGDGFSVSSDNKINWNCPINEFTLVNPGTISINLTSTYKDDSLGGLESTVSTGNKTYSFLYRRFWLTSSKSELNSADISSTTSSDLNNGYTKSSTTFNCSGGKYPYFILPTASVTGSGKRLPQFWVGGLQNTDLTSGTMNLNRNGINIEYTWIRLNNLQTSSNVKIEFK